MTIARAFGAVSDSRWAHFTSTRDEIGRVTEILRSVALSPQVRISTLYLRSFILMIL